MSTDRRTMLAGTLGLAAAPALGMAQVAQAGWPPPESFSLWPAGQTPNRPRRLPTPMATRSGEPPRRELHLTGVVAPMVGVYRPARPDGRALLAIPGGGYRFLSIENEGINVARAFNARGVTVFVLAYRLPGEGWLEPMDVPLQDGQRAMRLIRAGAARFGIDARRIGCVGFSAGGLLAASLAVAHADPVYAPIDAADRESARPAWAGLVYPVTSGDRMRVGPGGAARFDAPRRVRGDTPPLFIAHALDDPLVPLAEPLAMMHAAREAKVEVEAHFFAKGGHGFGPAYLPATLPGAKWPELFDLWMEGLSNSPTRV